MLKSSFAARLAAPVLCACLAAAPARAQVQALTLPQALQEARDNLDVALARGGLAAARADVLAADRAPFPVLSGKLSSIDLQNGVGSGPWHRKRIDKGIGIDWTWERGDKRVLRTRGAEATAGAAAQDLDEVVVRQMLAAQGAFYDLLAAQQRLALAEALADDVRQLADSSGRRARAGDLARQDATRIEIEAGRVRADAEAAVLERQRAALALGLLTGRAQQAERLAVAGDWPPLASAAASADLAALAQARPDVLAAARRVQAAHAAVDGARALRKADVTWGVSLNHYPGTSTRLVELRAQLPLQWGYGFEGEVGRALAQLRQAEDGHEQVQRAALADLRRLQLEAGTAAERVRRYDQDILPRARQVAQSAEFAYQKGALSLTDLLDARRTLRATLVEALALRAEAAKADGAWRLRTAPLAADPLSPTSEGTP